MLDKDILNWWAKHEDKIPTVAKLARWALSVQAAAAASER